MKSAFKTATFWLTGLAALALLLLDVLPPSEVCDGVTWILRTAALMGAGLASVGYSVTRGKAKAAASADRKPMVGTTEFWITIVIAVAASVPVVFLDGPACPSDPIIVKIAGAVAAGLAVLGFGAGRRIANG